MSKDPKVNAFKHLVQNRSNAEKTADYIRDDLKKKKISIWLKSMSGLYWMLAEGVLEYAVVSGLVILEQSGLYVARLVVFWHPPVFLFGIAD